MNQNRAALRDPQLYPDPDKFIPERWLPSSSKESPMNSNKIGFGFGRRYQYLETRPPPHSSFSDLHRI